MAAMRLLTSADLSTCGHPELDVLTGELQRVRGFVAAYDIGLARRRDEVLAGAAVPVTGAADHGATDDAAAPGGAVPGEAAPATLDGLPLDLSGLDGGRDLRPGRDSEHDRARARVCAVFATLEAALADGRVDAAHVDAVVAAWADLDDTERGDFARCEEMLVGYATVESPERFRRRVRDLARRIQRDHGQRVAERQRAEQRVRRWIDGRTGMGRLDIDLDAENTAKVWAALEERLAEWKAREDTAGVPLQRLEVDAIVELLTASSALDPRQPELSVLIDLRTLQTGVFGAGSVCETSDGQVLTPAAVRRLACEAGFLPVVLGGDGVPLDVGRKRRLATAEQRRALAAMYATCAMPGCGTAFERCRIHHCDPWLPSGPTDMENLVPLCNRHHHLVHEGGWTLTMTPERVITLYAPDGTVQFCGDTRDRIPAETIDGDVLDEVDTAAEWLGRRNDDAHDVIVCERRLAVILRTRIEAIRRERTSSRDTSTNVLATTQSRRGP
jgi:Domain of unknown function (DUF222)